MSRTALQRRFDREAEALLKQWLAQFADGVGTYGELRQLISRALEATYELGRKAAAP